MVTIYFAEFSGSIRNFLCRDEYIAFSCSSKRIEGARNENHPYLLVFTHVRPLPVFLDEIFVTLLRICSVKSWRNFSLIIMKS